jgi:hypothetical protein
VEFGSIRVHLGSLPEVLRPSVRAGLRPFASLLLEHRPRPVRQRIRPQALFALRWDRTIRTLIGDSSLTTTPLALAQQLPADAQRTTTGAEAAGCDAEDEDAPIVYGRCNFIFACDDDDSNENDESAAAAAAVVEVESAARQGRTPEVTAAQRARLICEVVEIMPPL